MNIASKIASLLVAIRKEDIEQLCPAERLRFAQLCQRAAILAVPTAQLNNSQVEPAQSCGVLVELERQRYRRDE